MRYCQNTKGDILYGPPVKLDLFSNKTLERYHGHETFYL